MKITIHTAVSDTEKNGIRASSALSLQSALDYLVVDHKGLIDQHPCQDSFFDAVDDGAYKDINHLGIESMEFDLMEMIKRNMHPSEVPEGKPYLYTLRIVYGCYEETCTYLSYSDDPETRLKDLAQEERGSDKEDWDEDRCGYWFDGNIVLCKGYREITPAEAFIWSKAMELKTGFRL